MSELSERKKQILAAVVEQYIKTGEPVGSKGLISSTGMSVSSATIRNEMSELAAMGYLEQPHTSAGRIPSPKGYRLYVNELMEQHRVATDELEAMRLMMQAKMREIDNIMVSASKVLSEMTQHTAVSMISRSGGSQVKKCELIDVDGGYTYAVVLVTDSDVKNKMLISMVFEHIKDSDKINQTVRNIIDIYITKYNIKHKILKHFFILPPSNIFC